MEKKLSILKIPAKKNTTEVIKLVLERAESRNINRIILVSIRDYTAKSFLDAVEGKDISLVVIPWVSVNLYKLICFMI